MGKGLRIQVAHNKGFDVLQRAYESRNGWYVRVSADADVVQTREFRRQRLEYNGVREGVHVEFETS
jgi:hypothetical protein